jgi:uncharacterized protein
MSMPAFKISVGGVDVGSRTAGGGISLAITDGVGVNSDTAEISIDDQDGSVAVPSTGVEMSISGGYEGQMRDFGIFVVDQVSLEGYPQRINISAQSAGAKTALKQRRTKAYKQQDYPTYQKIFSEIAGRNGLKLSISSEIGSKSVEYEGQAEEDDSAFLTRLGAKLDAAVSIKNKRLIAVKRGKGQSAGGQELPPIVIRKPGNLLTYSVALKDKPKHKNVKAHWFDRKKVKHEEVTASAGTDGPDFVLRTPFQSEGEARDAAEAKGKELARSESTATFSIDGEPSASAEAIVTVSGVRARVNGRWRATSVSHNWSSGGPYTTEVQCELPS